MSSQTNIEKTVCADDVVLFMKGMPGDSPCGYSTRLVTILDHLGVSYKAVDVLQSQDIRKSVKEFSGIKTLPQLFINGDYVGGSDDIRKLYSEGHLDGFLEDRGVIFVRDANRGTLHIDDVSREEVINCSKAGKEISGQ